MMNLFNLNRLAIVTALGWAGLATAAAADPCKAIPDRGPMPSWLAKGAVFSGPVVYVGDGDSLCVDVVGRRHPLDWVEVRLADFYAPEISEPDGPAAKRVLEREALSRRAVCVAGHRTHDRVAAVCRIGGVSVGDLMRRAGVREGGRGR